MPALILGAAEYGGGSGAPARPPSGAGDKGSVLVVDDDAMVRRVLARSLTSLGYACTTVAEASEALAAVAARPAPGVVLLDVHMPGTSGLELLGRIKAENRWVEVVMLSGDQDLDTVRFCLRQGAYDYLTKPAKLAELSQTVARAFERGRLVRENLDYQLGLERRVAERTEELREARDAALLTLAKLAESRDPETGRHLERIAEYARLLARRLGEGPCRDRIGAAFEEEIFRASPMHDVGKVSIPDAILLKPGPLTPEEMAVMRTHATVGGDILRAVIGERRTNGSLAMAMEIAYEHHEKWDGSGYPAGLAGEAISLPARIVALVDAYDALTSARPYKPAFTHEVALARIAVDRGRHFDPLIVDAFLAAHERFRQIHRERSDAPSA